MNIIKTLTVTTLACLALSQPALAAGYLKIGDIKGESTRSDQQKPNNQDVKSGQTDQPAGLLLPAVQQVREAAPRPRPNDSKGNKKGKVEASWKVEKGEK